MLIRLRVILFLLTDEQALSNNIMLLKHVKVIYFSYSTQLKKSQDLFTLQFLIFLSV